MDGVPYLSGSRMNGLAGALEVCAANVANANTPGYKRLVGCFETEGAGRAGASPAASWPRPVRPRIDPSQGPVRRTGRELDLAVRGPGFFGVQTPAGRRYTRKGRFFTDADGQLVDGAGNPVVTDGGSLALPVDGGQVTIEAGGEVLVDGQVLGRIGLFDIPDGEALHPEGASTYRNDGPPATEALDSTVVQGNIEESNVRPVRQMVKMLTTMRAYEATARLLKRADRLSAKLIQTAA